MKTRTTDFYDGRGENDIHPFHQLDPSVRSPKNSGSITGTVTVSYMILKNIYNINLWFKNIVKAVVFVVNRGYGQILSLVRFSSYIALSKYKTKPVYYSKRAD